MQKKVKKKNEEVEWSGILRVEWAVQNASSLGAGRVKRFLAKCGQEGFMDEMEKER